MKGIPGKVAKNSQIFPDTPSVVAVGNDQINDKPRSALREARPLRRLTAVTDAAYAFTTGRRQSGASSTASTAVP